VIKLIKTQITSVKLPSLPGEIADIPAETVSGTDEIWRPRKRSFAMILLRMAYPVVT